MICSPFHGRARDRRIRLLIGLCIGPLAIPFWAPPRGLFAQESESVARNDFDIPVGNAIQTLGQFTVQAKCEIIYSPELVRGVATRAVRGQFLVMEALNRMLAGTSLVAREDQKTGAIAVNRVSREGKRSPEAIRDRSVVTLQKMVVTGSNMPMAGDASPSPLTIIGAEDIEGTGLYANFGEILRKLNPAFMGVGNKGVATRNGKPGGGTQIMLRDMPTLVLIDGRRIAENGAAVAVTGDTSVDVDMIPAAAIERVEILSDGSSAIYGSDAIGGVLNFILKSDYHGAEIGSRVGEATDGTYTERSAYVVGGGGAHGVNVTVSGSWSKTDPLLQNQRDFIRTNPQNGTNFPGFVGGNFLNPNIGSPTQSNPVGINAKAASMADLVANGTYLAAGSGSIPRFDIAPYVNLLTQEEQQAAVVNGSADLIGKKLVAFGNYLHANTKSAAGTIGSFGNLVTATVPAASPYNPLRVAVPGVVVGASGPMQYHTKGTYDRATFGFRGDINQDWSWEVGYVDSTSKMNQQTTNELFAPNLDAAIAGGYDASGNPVAGGAYSKVHSGFSPAGPLVLQPALDPFARPSAANPASLANLYGTQIINSAGRLESYDAKIVSTAVELPAGKLGLAIGGAVRKESESGTPDQNSYTSFTDPTRHNWAPGPFFDPFSRGRTIDSLFVEARVPIFSSDWSLPGAHELELTLAGRQEKYSDFGTSRVPKFGLRWEPVDDQFTLRATASKSFVAPLLGSEYANVSGAFQTNDRFATFLGYPALKGKTYFVGNGPNTDLKPSTATSTSFGFVFSPRAVKGFTLSVEYVKAVLHGLANGIGQQAIMSSVNSLGSASPYFSSLWVGGLPGDPNATQAPLAAPGGLAAYVGNPAYKGDVYLIDHQVNSTGESQDAIDLSMSFETAPTAAGKFIFRADGTFIRSFRVQSKTDFLYHEYAGFLPQNGPSGTLPKLAVHSSLHWACNQWSANLGNTYVSSMTDTSPSDPYPEMSAAKNTIGYYTTWDLQVSYLWHGFDGLKFSFGVNNLFNRQGPSAPLQLAPASGYTSVDADIYSPIGRFVFGAIDLKF